jgi:hypothetical protein
MEKIKGIQNSITENVNWSLQGEQEQDFVVCTLAVKKKKSGQVSTCRIGPFPCQFQDRLLLELAGNN